MAGSGLEEWLHASGLEAKLAAVCADNSIKEASVAIACGQSSRFLRANSDGLADDDDSMVTLTGCLTKSFTASALATTLKAGDLSPSVPIGTLAPGAHGILAHERVRPLTPIQLLTHTHGLDDSALDREWTFESAALDREVDAMAMVRVPPLYEPGALHSYGSGGATLAALLTEHLTGSSYEQVLQAELLDKLGLTRIHRDALGDDTVTLRAICPAIGATFALSMRDIVTYVRWHIGLMQPEPAEPLASVPALLRSQHIELPGWSPFERAICLGWKYFGSDWYGHNANICGHSLIVRFAPKSAALLVIAARNEPMDAALTVLINLFGKCLPEFSQLRIPRRLNSSEAAELIARQYEGSYANARDLIRISADDRQQLTLQFTALPGDVRVAECGLSPAQRSIFFSQPATRDIPPYIQFGGADSAGHFQYVWNGKKVWPRRAVAAAAADSPT